MSTADFQFLPLPFGRMSTATALYSTSTAGVYEQGGQAALPTHALFVVVRVRGWARLMAFPRVPVQRNHAPMRRHSQQDDEKRDELDSRSSVKGIVTVYSNSNLIRQQKAAQEIISVRKWLYSNCKDSRCYYRNRTSLSLL